jgi:nucleoside-triphosphatase
LTPTGATHRKNVFVTGRPGVGKTTLLGRVLTEIERATDGVAVGGFVTREIRDNGTRVGFEIADLAGESGVLAHVDLDSEYRVGRYGVNRADLERVGVPAVARAVEEACLVVMDEVGRMELCSPAFQAEVAAALDSSKPVLGTLQDRRNTFLDGIRARDDVEILRVTESNRDDMAATVRELMLRLLRPYTGV